MGRGHYHPKSCKVCQKSHVEVGKISATGKCALCGNAAFIDNVTDMRTRSGDGWRKWRRSMAACVGGQLLDEHRDEA